MGKPGGARFRNLLPGTEGSILPQPAALLQWRGGGGYFPHGGPRHARDHGVAEGGAADASHLHLWWPVTRMPRRYNCTTGGEGLPTAISSNRRRRGIPFTF